MLAFSGCIKERFEGHKLFLTNYQLRTILWLSGSSIDLYYNIKRQPEVLLPELDKLDPSLFDALLQCHIIYDKNNGDDTRVSTSLSKRPILSPVRYNLCSHLAPFGALWEITGKCNSNCVYCLSRSPAKHRSGEIQDLSLQSLFTIADKLAASNIFEVTLSGGEPLLRGDDLFALIDYLHRRQIYVCVISNGLSVTRDIVGKLKDRNVPVAISLDTYCDDKQRITRGEGSFRAAVDAITLLIGDKVRTNVVCTLTRHNVDDLDTYLGFVKSLGITVVVIQNLIPGGNLDVYRKLRLSPTQELSLPKLLPGLVERHGDLSINFTETGIFSFLEFDDKSLVDSLYSSNVRSTLMNGCGACRNGVYINSIGTVHPCTSLQMLPLGNLCKEDLPTIWITSDNARFIRDIMSKTTDALRGCTSCGYKYICTGGCRGQAFALYNDWYALHDRCLARLRESFRSSQL